MTSRNTKANISPTSIKKGKRTSDDIKLVSLRNSFATLNEENKVLENVVTSIVGKEANKDCEDNESYVEDVYDEIADFKAQQSLKVGSWWESGSV